jgi:hypothetical protein
MHISGFGNLQISKKYRAAIDVVFAGRVGRQKGLRPSV